MFQNSNGLQIMFEGDGLSEPQREGGTNLLTLMGNVLGTWQGVEHMVAKLYLNFFGPDRTDAAAIVLFSIRTFEARLTALDALIAYFGSDETKAVWSKLHARVRRKSKMRNAVAHGLIALHGVGEEASFVLGRSVYDLANLNDPTNRQSYYSVKELSDMCVVSEQLRDELQEFNLVLQADQTLQTKLGARPQKAAANAARYPLKGRIRPRQ